MPLFWCSGLQSSHPDVKVAVWSFHPSSMAPRNLQQSPLWGNLPSTSHHTSSSILDVSPTVTSPRHPFLNRGIHPALSGQRVIYSNPHPLTLVPRVWLYSHSTGIFFFVKVLFCKNPNASKTVRKAEGTKEKWRVWHENCGRRHYETRESEFRIPQTTII